MALTRAQRRQLENQGSSQSSNGEAEQTTRSEMTPARSKSKRATKKDIQTKAKDPEPVEAIVEEETTVVEEIVTVVQQQMEEIKNDSKAETKDNKHEDSDSNAEAASSAASDEDQDEEEEVNNNDQEFSDEDQQSSDEDQDSSSDDDDDLDALLHKAKAALQAKAMSASSDMVALEKNDKTIKTTLPKLETGVKMDQLYIKKDHKVAKLSEKAMADEAPEIVDPHMTTETLTRKQRQQERAKTAGKGWFDMAKPEMTPELKRDLQVIKMRHVLDRKRHYKKMGKNSDPTYFQVGTIIEGPTEFFSARQTKKERKRTIVDELMADEDAKQYYKRKFKEVDSKSRSGRKRAKQLLKKQQ